MPFNFQLIDAAWNAPALAAIVREYDAAVPSGAWPNWVLGNHDRARIASRVGVAGARIAAMLLLTLRGTPTMYYGDELGMVDVPIASEFVQDPAEKNQPGIGVGRDPERTPMPWDGSPLGGFTSGRPWLPLGDHTHVNVTAELADPGSMLSLYRRLLALRREHAALVDGTLSAVEAVNGVLRYERHAANERLVVLLNFTDDRRWVQAVPGRVLLSTSCDRLPGPVDETVELSAAEGLVIVV